MRGVERLRGMVRTLAGCVVAAGTDVHSTDVRAATLPGRSQPWKDTCCDGSDKRLARRLLRGLNGRRGGACSRPPLTRVDAVPAPSSRGSRRVAALLTGVQALVLVGFAVFYVVELASGEGSDAVRVLMSALLICVAAVGLGALVRGWLGTASWPRTPTIVWNALLLPVGISLIQGSRVAVGWLVLLVAVVVIGAAWVARDPDTEVLPGRDLPD